MQVDFRLWLSILRLLWPSRSFRWIVLWKHFPKPKMCTLLSHMIKLLTLNTLMNNQITLILALKSVCPPTNYSKVLPKSQAQSSCVSVNYISPLFPSTTDTNCGLWHRVFSSLTLSSTPSSLFLLWLEALGKKPTRESSLFITPANQETVHGEQLWEWWERSGTIVSHCVYHTPASHRHSALVSSCGIRHNLWPLTL